MSAGVLKTRPRALWPETIDTMQCLLIAEVRAVTATTGIHGEKASCTRVVSILRISKVAGSEMRQESASDSSSVNLRAKQDFFGIVSWSPQPNPGHVLATPTAVNVLALAFVASATGSPVAGRVQDGDMPASAITSL
jgi:hypothetical protein